MVMLKVNGYRIEDKGGRSPNLHFVNPDGTRYPIRVYSVPPVYRFVDDRNNDASTEHGADTLTELLEMYISYKGGFLQDRLDLEWS